MCEYPDELLRGISTSEHLCEDNTPYSALFSFPGVSNDNGYKELSINWYDNENAKEILLNQKKKDTNEFQFKIGFAILDRLKLDNIIKKRKTLSYNRDPIEPHNIYHGNLLLHIDTPNKLSKIIPSEIALNACKEIILRDSE